MASKLDRSTAESASIISSMSSIRTNGRGNWFARTATGFAALICILLSIWISDRDGRVRDSALSWAESEVRAVCGEWDADRLFKIVTPGFLERHSTVIVEQEMCEYATTLGSIVELSVLEWSIGESSDAKVSLALVAYDATFEQSHATVYIRLLGRPGSWRIDGFGVSKPRNRAQ